MTGKDGNKFDAILKYEKNNNGYYVLNLYCW